MSEGLVYRAERDDGAYHFARDSGGHSLCGVPLVSEDTVPADVALWQRCLLGGCRRRWRGIGSRPLPLVPTYDEVCGAIDDLGGGDTSTDKIVDLLVDRRWLTVEWDRE